MAVSVVSFSFSMAAQPEPNYYSTAGSGIPSRRNHSITNHILNG